ncbi:MAG TPA: hypothetical protein DCZ19_05995 [Porphyromonadaceae bacterium]|nr:hypothetical protein [Porphyromonadaceae bacterium]HCC17242.1 hypothetical protein [Porphyromonadaceae bacterium]
MSNYKYYLSLLLILIFITCQNRSNTPEQDEDIFALIQYPEGFDTLNCNRFGPDWKPYPCLNLDKKTIQEIDSLYGKPSTTLIDTLYYGKRKNDMYYNPEIGEMLSNIPFAKVTYTYRRVMGYVLMLYFIEQDKKDVVFYGFRYNPHTRMIE